MNIVKTEIEGVLIIEPPLFLDAVATSLRVSASESLKKRLPQSWGTVYTSAKTSVITSIIQRLMEVFQFLMIPSASIGRFQQSMLISLRKIRSMQC